ncbi:subtilisin-like protein [Flammula alnicola]|nr:subtilisin-like protein [Flammula alnicola]
MGIFLTPAVLGSMIIKQYSRNVSSTVGAIPTKDCAYKVKEEISPPRGWVKHSQPAPDHKIVLKIALPQPNFSELERHLYEVSDPDHERYGQHLSKEEVEELVAPHPESLDSVNEWLSSFGFTDDDLVRSAAKDWVTLKVPVSLAEKMLDTKYHVWKHTESGDYLVRTTTYSLPTNLHDHVELIQPTTMFGRFKPDKSNIFKATPIPDSLIQASKGESPINAASGITVDPSCNSIITITCLQQLYNAVGFTPSAKGNSIGITGYLGQFANLQDLQSFFADERPDALNSSFKFISVAGGQNNQSLAAAGDEADLDVQFAFGLSHPISPTFFSTAGSPPFTPDDDTPTDTNEPYTTWLDFILSDPSPPLTISTSYGDDEQTVPLSFAQRACAGFAQLGARGVSLTFSSGDFGVGDGNPDPATQTCITNDGRNLTKFIPAFPASITSVGGTSHIPEVAVATFFSGGGFSNYFSRPSYQDDSVKDFLNTLPKGTYAGLFNPFGIPDVSAQADLFKVFIGGGAFLIGGTSAASPTFAGFVALLNDVRLKAHLPPLGFLNPFLYSKGFEGLNDITSGNNAGCGTPGFNATKGWDPVTGLGTPNFGKLKELVVQN